MQSIQAIMQEILNQPNMKAYFDRAVQLVNQDPAIGEFIKAHQADITSEMLRNSLSKLNEFRIERLAIANGGVGANPGFEPMLVLRADYIDVTYVPTKDYLAQAEQRAIAAKLDNRMMSADVRGARLDQYELDSTQRGVAFEAVTQFIQGYQQAPTRAQGLYLTGPYGVGKTYLLGALANFLVEQEHVHVTLLHYPTFAVEMREAISQGTTQQLLTQVKTVDVLMLDDMGAENDPSGWVRDDVLAIILEYRMKESLPTFFTSNFDMEELETILATNQNGTSVVRAKRLMERIRFLAREVKMDGVNRRMQLRQG